MAAYELTGDVFALALEVEILEEVNRRLKLRGLPPKSLPLQYDMDLLLEILPPGGVQRNDEKLCMCAAVEYH